MIDRENTADNWGPGKDDSHLYQDIESFAPSNYGDLPDEVIGQRDDYGNQYNGNQDQGWGNQDYGEANYQQQQQAPPPLQQKAAKLPTTNKKGGGFLCCFKPKEDPEDKYQEEYHDVAPRKTTSVNEPAAVMASDLALKGNLPIVLSGEKQDGSKIPDGSQRSRISSRVLPSLPDGSVKPKPPPRPASRAASRAGTEMSVASEAMSKFSLGGATPPPPARSADAATAIESFLQVASSQRDPDVRAAATDIAKLQRIMRAVAPKMDDLAEAAELAAMLDLASAELSSGEPVTQAKDLAAEAAVALSAAFDWLGSAGPVRVIRSPEARLMWVSLFGMDEMAPFDAFSERLVGYLKEAFPNGDPKQVGERLGKVESAQSRLRWHVDKDNKNAITVMDVDRAFPPHISLVERVGTFIDTPPDTPAAFAAASVCLPSRPGPGRLLGRETDVAMALDRLTKANEDIVILAAPGLGGSSVLAEVANRALIKGEFPGGVYYTDLAGVETRESAAVALSLALNAPRGVAEKDVDAAVVAALRHIGTERLTLIVFDAAESLVASSATGGEDFCAFVTKLQSVGPQIRFLVGTSHPFPFDGFGVVRVGPAPSRDLVKAFQDASPAGWEWRVSHNAAKEMVNLTARVPLAYRINKVKNSGDVLLALREARGIRIEGDLENMCSCDMQTPWEAWQEIWTDKKEDKEARLAAAGSAGAESEFAAENGNARVAGLKLSAYERMIAGCVKLSFDGASDPARATLVAVALFHAPFSLASAAVVADRPQLETKGCLEELCSLGLVERDERRGVYSVHDLVRSALRAQGGERDAAVAAAKQRLMGVATRAVMASSDDIDAGRTQLGKYALDCQRPLLDQVASHWFSTGADAETVTRAEWVAEKIEAMRADRVEPDDAPVDTVDTTGELTLMRSQAEDHFANERFDRARDLYRTLLEAQAGREGGYALSTAVTRVRIGDACCELGEFPEAIAEYEKALVTQVVVHGTREHQDVAALHIAVGNCKLKAGDAAGAAVEYRLALDVTARLFGQESIHCAAPLNALGNAYREQFAFDDALERYRLALQIRRAALGESHVATQDTIANIAAVYAEQGRHKEAAEMLIKAGLVFSRELGAQHPDTVKVQVMAARMLEEHKRNAQPSGNALKEHELRL